MDISFKTIILIVAVICTGLSAGLFYAWSVSVIPGTQKISDATYLETMQSINREILNPSFFLSFFGSLILLALSAFLMRGEGLAFWLMLSATVVYAIGTFGVTAGGNVPLNNELDALNLAELLPQKAEEFRTYYESSWNRFHMIRMIAALLSFILALFSITKS
jgi:uncharacterized membrane protein